MKIVSVKQLGIPDVQVLEFGVFEDRRGYFGETFRQEQVASLKGFEAFSSGIVQVNQSHSFAGVMRGLHFQWNPFVGKLVRTVSGRMVDMVVDIRVGSPTFGKGLMYDMPDNHREWIWVPPGMAHGNFFTEETTIEYFCTGAYNPTCEAGISPLSTDIDWSFALDPLLGSFCSIGWLMTDKDKNGMSMGTWARDPRSEVFKFGGGTA